MNINCLVLLIVVLVITKDTNVVALDNNTEDTAEEDDTTELNIEEIVKETWPIWCQLQPDRGYCNYTTNHTEYRFYYDRDIDECGEFEYSFCGGNRNNFNILVDCENKCKGNEVVTEIDPVFNCLVKPLILNCNLTPTIPVTPSRYPITFNPYLWMVTYDQQQTSTEARRPGVQLYYFNITTEKCMMFEKTRDPHEDCEGLNLFTSYDNCMGSCKDVIDLEKRLDNATYLQEDLSQFTQLAEP